jgi:hypothetical protein
MKPTTRHGTGQTGEYLVAAELARHGFTVALPTGNAESIDVLAYGFGMSLAVQVKTAGRGDHQFNLGKFVDIAHEIDGRQDIRGRKDTLDPKILMALVFLGERAGDDQFCWTTLGDFADFLAESHANYLARNGGRRPGKNPKSMHASLSKKALQERFPFDNPIELVQGGPKHIENAKQAVGDRIENLVAEPAISSPSPERAAKLDSSKL